MNKTILKRPEVIVGVIVFLLLVIAAIYILKPSGIPSSSTLETPVQTDLLIADNSSEGQQINVLPIDDNKVITIGSFKVTFDTNFFVNSIVQAKQVSNIQCGLDTDNGCVIDFLINGITTYYVSTPKTPIAVDGLDRSNDKLIDLNGHFFSYSYVTKVEDSENAAPFESKTVSQIYGCVKDNICVGSGVFDTLDDVHNAQQVSDFENFVKSIQIN